MAHFYGSMQGARGEATRCGTKASGISAHIRGWSTGVRVTIDHVNGRDRVVVTRTGGSNANADRETLAEWWEDDTRNVA